MKDSARKDMQKWIDTIGADMETVAQIEEHRPLYQLVKQLPEKFVVDAPFVNHLSRE